MSVLRLQTVGSQEGMAPSQVPSVVQVMLLAPVRLQPRSHLNLVFSPGIRGPVSV